MSKHRAWIASLLATLLPAALHAQAAQRDPVPPDALEGPARRVRFAAIGDYGDAGFPEADVAALVHSWRPAFVITLGDNNYDNGAQATIDANIGQYYSRYIGDYAGVYGDGARSNRFFPSLGNHDWITAGAQPYLSYFTLPGNERYYDVVRGPVHLFALDSDTHEPHGTSPGSVQGAWLQARLAASTAPFKVVYFHHTPFSSGDHGNERRMMWPFDAWGAHAVLAGHDHHYERVLVDGFPYLTNGLGGRELYDVGEAITGSRYRFNGDYGALLCEATPTLFSVRFVTRDGIVVDTFATTPARASFAESELLSFGSSWRYLDDGSDQGTAWRDAGFDDSGWRLGPAELGYGDGDEATVVSFGPNANQKYVTTYFRTTVDVLAPGAFRGIRLELVRDDGAVVWVNGVEAYRSNLPAGPVDSLTLAPLAIAGSHENASVGPLLDPSLFVPGTNTLAVELHQQSQTSSDLSFDLALVGVEDVPPLVPRGSLWSYLDDGSDPGPTWTEPSFDDSGWPVGPAELGYGDGDEATVVSFGPDPNQKYTTTWFRTSFDVADPALYTSLVLDLVRDDGVACFLNGQEVYRSNLPLSGTTASTLAGFAVTGADEAAVIQTTIDPSLLLPGTNTLAVELHQNDPASSDLSFDLELVGL